MAGEERVDVSSGLKALSKLESDEAEKVDFTLNLSLVHVVARVSPWHETADY